MFEKNGDRVSFTQISEERNSTMLKEENLEDFEAKIAYFFGVPDQMPVMNAYLNALKKLEAIRSDQSIELLEKDVLPDLEKAYQSIAKQRGWDFNTHLAAELELKIILGNLEGSSFEKVTDLMVQLYSLVFQSNSPLILKAAMLRTFLYQYKAEVLKREQKISEQDRSLMLKIAKTSEEFLNSIRR